MVTREQYVEERPAWIDTDSDLATLEDYLDCLRESGVTNMFGAGAYLETEFDLSTSRAGEMLLYWMKFYGHRYKEETS